MKAMSTQRRASEVEGLVRRHQATVRGFLLFLGCPADRVDDLVQDVFLSVLSSRFEYHGEARAAAFLRKVARHLFFKTMRRERRQLALGDAEGALELDDLERAWVAFEADDGGEGYLQALRQCLDSLRERARDVLLSRYRKGMSLAEIARHLELSESGVKSILVRSKRGLRRCIERRLPR